MIVSRMVKSARTVLLLITVAVICSLVLGMNALPASDPGVADAPAAETDSTPSVTCIPLGLFGDITTPVLVGRLSDSSDNLTFVGTTNGLYVVAPGGKLEHFLYSPFGIKHMALIDDITGDGIREVVVALNDTQVPALRCYNGATWEKVWQFAPMAKIWDKLWVERQLIITNLEVVEDSDPQSLLITSGRCVLSVDAKDGTERWRFSASSALRRMVTLADLNGDDTEEAFVGSDDGYLYWLSVRTGKVQWQTKLPRHKEVDYVGVAHLVSDIVVLNRESGKVAVASGDGWAQMYDLVEKKREWDTRVFEEVSPSYQMSEYLLMSPTADITEDGLPEVLLTKTPSSDPYSGYNTTGKAALCDSAGNKLWDRDSFVWPGMAFETGVFDNKPVFLERTAQELALVDLKDGESILHTIPLSALVDPGLIVKQPGGDGYLTFSSTGDLAAMSSSGQMLWYYPRITSVKAESGNFVGDATKDVLLEGESGTPQSSGSVPIYDIEGKTIGITDPTYAPQEQEPEVRLLQMMDGATRAIAWSNEVPYGKFKSLGGLMGIQVVPDLVGSDGIQDIIGYSEDTVLIFSGKDGARSSFPVGQPIESLEVIRYGSSGNSIAVSIAGGLMIFDITGTPLWTTTSAGWVGDETGSFMMLDDINSDNISDLAVTSAAEIVVLKSVAATDNYELHLTFKAETGHSISYVEIVPDVDNDGVRDLAYLQTGESTQQGSEYVEPPNPLLSQRSLVDGTEFFKVQLPAYWSAYDLACGDFNGDGYADSLFSSYGSGSSESEYIGTVLNLSILSGKDGTTLRTHSIDANNRGGLPAGGTPLAINIGDCDGDGADDLAYTSTPGGSYEYMPGGGYSYTPPEDMQLSVHVYSAARDAILKSVPATPHLNYYHSEGNPSPLAIDVDGDGYLEAVSAVSEPWIPSYDADYNSSSRQYVAVVDIDSSRRLAGFTGFDSTTMSLFDAHQPGTLGVAACGGACFLHMNADLQVTSPENEARTEPNVGVRWDGPSDGDFSEVFVDGVRNDTTNGLDAGLYLGRGDHDIVVRSVDDCGRISYGPSDLSAPLTIKVTPSPWKPAWLVLSLFALLAVVLLLFYARLHRTWRARRRAVK
jgi:hypothetical protein